MEAVHGAIFVDAEEGEELVGNFVGGDGGGGGGGILHGIV